MASPTVQATAESVTSTAGTTHSVNLPTGIAAGDLLLLCSDKGSTAATVNALTGWTELLDENSANGLYVAYRWADGTEVGPLAMGTSASTRLATIALRVSGAENPATQAPQIGTTATGTSVNPDPPAVTPTGGSKDYLSVAFFGSAGEEADDDTWVTAVPTGYTSPALQKTGGVAGTNLGALLGLTYRQFTGASEDPGTFTMAVSAAWRAQTLIVPPSGDAPAGGAGEMAGRRRNRLVNAVKALSL